MLIKFLLLLLALFLLTGLSGCMGGKVEPASALYDPCKQMQIDGENVDSLHEELKGLQSRVEHEDTVTYPDTGGMVPAESLMVMKEQQLALATETMADDVEACQVNKRGWDLYRTEEEKEEGQ